MDDFTRKFNLATQKDAEIHARNHAKNELESYIYNMRDKVTSSYQAYILEADREAFLSDLDSTESWLYDDEGYYAKREVFEERLSKLQKIGEPVATRFREAQERPDAVTKLSERLETVERLLNTPNEKYEHITAEDRKPVFDLVAESRSWLSDMLNKQSMKNMTDDPILLVADLRDRLNNVNALFDKVMSKPKPKPKKAETPKSPKEGEETPKTPKSPKSPKEGEEKEGETPKSPKSPKSPSVEKTEKEKSMEVESDDGKMEVE